MISNSNPKKKNDLAHDDLAPVDQIVSALGTAPDAVIPILHAIQEQYRYLPPNALERVCELTEITPASIAGVSTFYTHFRHKPVGEHIVQVCQGTACHVKGAQLVQESIELHLGLSEGQDTDDEGRFTVQPVACLGCCTLAPVVQVDSATYGHVTPRNVAQVISDAVLTPKTDRPVAQSSTSRGVASPGEKRIGLGSCCLAPGRGTTPDEAISVGTSSGAGADVEVVGWIGVCPDNPPA